MTANQQCPDCGSPLRPCICNRQKTPKRLRSKSFTEKYDGTGDRYGYLFQEIRDLPCWLALANYAGPGHRGCDRGVQGRHTAHHVGRTDAEGLLPGCGRAHDLYAGLGGAQTVAVFRGWLDLNGYRLEVIALAYVESVREQLA